MLQAIIIVDHGSRREESNRMLEEVTRLFADRFRDRFPIVEAAHMELCEPSIATAYAACVKRGAQQVIVVPFFLGPGKHWTKDIPELTRDAAADYPQTRYHVAMPLGIDDLMLELLAKRAGDCVANGLVCDACRGTLRSGESDVASETAPKPQPTHKGPITCSTCPYAAAGIPLP